MAPKSQREKGRDRVLLALNVIIEGLNLAKEVSSATPAKAVFGSASIVLSMIRVSSLDPFVSRFPANALRIQWPTERIILN